MSAATARAGAPVKFTVPGLPPSMNRYVRHAGGRHHRNSDAMEWDQDVATCCRMQDVQPVRAASYAVTVTFFYGSGQRGDLDNRAKCLLDSLVLAGVIDSDAKVAELHMAKQRDPECPRTEVEVVGL